MWNLLLQILMQEEVVLQGMNGVSHLQFRRSQAFHEPSAGEAHQEEERTQDPNPPLFRDHRQCPQIVHLSPVASYLKDQSMDDLLGIDKPKICLLSHSKDSRFPRINHHIIGQIGQQAQGKSQWEEGCKSYWERLVVGLSWPSTIPLYPQTQSLK
jgi:hypothetical protein